jgi:ZIP family zinc transporter
MPGWLTAGLLGLFSAAGLLVGAAAGWWLEARHQTIAAATAVGVGLLIAAASLYLITSALESVPASIAALGALIGGASFSLLNLVLKRWDADKRKRCGSCVRQPTEEEVPGSGLAIAFGSLLDAVPEALIIGAATTPAATTLPPLALIGAFTLGNFAEGLSSSAGMKQAGRNLRYVVTVWVGIALVTSLTAILGYAIFADIGLERGWLEAIAAGALIALVVETMAPEAVHGQPRFSGLLAMLGFAALLVALAYGDATSAWL